VRLDVQIESFNQNLGEFDKDRFGQFPIRSFTSVSFLARVSSINSRVGVDSFYLAGCGCRD